MTLRFKYASVPLVLRADQKDESYIRRLSDGMQSVATLLRGARFVSTYETTLATIAEAVYYYTTVVVTSQTLGDEYADLLPLTSSGQPLRWVIVHAATRVLTPLLLRRIVARLRPDLPAASVVHHVNVVHTAIFFMEGKYHTIANRLLGSRAISLSPERKSGGGSVYKWLGLILLVQEVILLVKWWKTARQAAEQQPRATGSAGGAGNTTSGATTAQASTASGAADSSDSDDGVDRGRCTLCLCDRRQPAATRCGHIFCWECIMRWFETSNQGSPICPNCRQPCSPQSVVLLANYALLNATAVASPTSSQAVMMPSS